VAPAALACAAVVPAGAADVVVSAPTVDEIRSVIEMEQAIQALAVKDATIQADLEFITKGIAAAGQLHEKVKV
jgi:hypothetical protein